MKRPALGACVAVFGVVFVTLLDLAYWRQSDLDDESVGAADIVWYLVIACPLLALALLTWRGLISSVALGAGMLISIAVLWAGFHAAWTSDSSTAALALLAAPMYALAAVALVFALDRIVEAVRRQRAMKP